jgi:hypothetical protein
MTYDASVKFGDAFGAMTAIKYDVLTALVRTFLVVIAIMSALVIGVSRIPNGPIAEHVRSSVSPIDYQSWPTSEKIDYFTECIAATLGLGPQMSALSRAFLSPVLTACEGPKGANAALDRGEYFWNYWRYWHGYQIVSRPVLYFFDLHVLRAIIFFCFCMSAYVFISTIASSYGKEYAAFAVMSLLCVPVISAAYLVSHSLIWIIAFLAGALLIRMVSEGARQLSIKTCLQLFLGIGMVTSFVDFLTTPLITLTVPLLSLYWGRKRVKGDQWWSSWFSTVAFCVTWGVGYGACWITKWIIVVLFFNADINEIFHQIVFRLSGKEDWIDITMLNSLKANLLAVTSGLVILASYFVICTARCIWQRRSLIAQPFETVNDALTYAIIFGLPFVWLSVLANHSQVHYWFVAPVLYPTFALGFSLIHESIEDRLQTTY